MIDRIADVPKGVYVGQTEIHHAMARPTDVSELRGFNVALHVGDDTARVQQHRMLLLNQLAAHGAKKLTWLNQTHSTTCIRVAENSQFLPHNADALVTSQVGHVLMIMTADCLPIVLGNAASNEVANLHAGWRGLAHGMIENTLHAMQTPVTWAWLGACISQACFEVGEEVKETFCQKYAVDFAFIPSENGKYFADLYAIARHILNQCGVQHVYGGGSCTYQATDQYYSYRRHPKTGRMATFVFLSE